MRASTARADSLHEIRRWNTEFTLKNAQFRKMDLTSSAMFQCSQVSDGAFFLWLIFDLWLVCYSREIFDR